MSGNLCINEVESCTITDAAATCSAPGCSISDLRSPIDISYRASRIHANGAAFFVMKTKMCGKCQQYKDYGEFGKNAIGKDGLHSLCKKCRAANMKVYREQNRDKIATYLTETREKRSAQKASYRITHREQVAAYDATYYATHKKAIAMTKAAWRASHHDQDIVRHAVWAKNNPEKCRAKTNRRRARKRGNGGTHTAEDVKRQGDCQNWKCWWQGPGCTIDCRDKYEVDHMIPLARGGHNYPGNIVISCPHCNRSKKDKMPEEWAGRLL